jgi:hypothetical protein
MFDSQESLLQICLKAERYKESNNTLAIHFKPTHIIQNLLSVPCKFLSTISNRSWKLESPLISPANEYGLMVDPNEDIQFQIMLPFMKSWSSPVTVNRESKHAIIVTDQQENKLKVDIEVQQDKIIIFVGYWVYDLVQLPENVQLRISSENFENVPSVFPAAEFSTKSGQPESLIEPLMFCTDSGKAYLRLSLQNSQFSRPFSIQAAGSSETVTVLAGSEAYQFIVNTSLCMAPFTRTKMVVFTPRYIIVNSLHFPIIYKQSGDLSEKRLESGETQPFYKWPNFKLPEKLCFKQDDSDSLWTNPIAVSEVVDETLTLQGTNRSRLARLEVQRGNSSFLLLSHQKSSLVPLVIFNRTVSCDVWVRPKGYSKTWQHLSSESGYPFGFGDQDIVSFRLGWLSNSGAQIVHKTDLNLSDLNENEFVFPWKGSNSHDIVFELEQRGPFQSVTISERIRSRDSLCASLSRIRSNVNDLVSQWTTKKVELTELTEDLNAADRYLQLNIIECSNLETPSDSNAVYLTAVAFGQTVQTPAVTDIIDPYFVSKHSFAINKEINDGIIKIGVYCFRASVPSLLFELDVKTNFETFVVEKWFNLKMGHRSVGQLHLSMQTFEWKSQLLKSEIQSERLFCCLQPLALISLKVSMLHC